MKKFAVILSGCGVYDGSEIHEATMAMLAICKLGHVYTLFAPGTIQHHSVNHLTGEEMPEQRNVFIESARIARGNIKDLKTLNVSDFDTLVLPGGFGVGKNLSNYAFAGSKMQIISDMENAIKTFHAAKKPIAAMCIAPVLIAKALGNVTLTIGNDVDTIKTIETLGAKHQTCSCKQIVSDFENRIFTAPCYMLETNIANVAEEAEKLIEACAKV